MNQGEAVSREDWNPWYLCYCRDHGNTPEQMLEQDRETYPGGKMAGFIIWSLRKRSEFFGQHPELAGEKRHNAETVNAYTEWLQEQGNVK